ncbi:MAG TPA: sigma 54-interacting transcriptional regulator [Chitinispirillaceae bacterium]|nr:sigma 54-interacting transcriptional regulator [Chitinispirillaceae bacterium]
MDCFVNEDLTPQCLKSILQTLAEGLFLVDNNGTIRFCNDSLKELTGKSAEEIIGKNCCTLMKEVCNPPPDCSLFSKGEIINKECQIIHKSGNLIPVLKNARILKDTQGKILGAVETITDISVLRKAEIRLQQLEQNSKKNRLGEIVGKSHVMQELYYLIELASASNATILVTGETGTGKELAAQAIHNHSSRKNGPFVKLNCSALPENLLESELFGHARGSFTGAINDKPGRFEAADGGTLFLDEIGELSPLIQVKLLRFLQEKEFERVGENNTRKTDVRIIAATHRNLRKMVQNGEFREDLYYRLKVFVVNIPPLRERKEDIGLLTDHFICRFNKETGKSIQGLTHDAAITMMDYCWPGNIRELENAIEHAFVTCQDTLIDIFDLPLEIRKVELRKNICNSSSQDSFTTAEKQSLYPPRHHIISDNELLKIFEECNGNQSETARRLGVDRTTVWRRIKKIQHSV